MSVCEVFFNKQFKVSSHKIDISYNKMQNLHAFRKTGDWKKFPIAGAWGDFIDPWVCAFVICAVREKCP